MDVISETLAGSNRTGAALTMHIPFFDMFKCNGFYP